MPQFTKHFAAPIAALAVLLAAPLVAQEIPMEGPAATAALIHTNGKGTTSLDGSMLQLQVNGRPAPITSVQAIQPNRTEIAILIDDGLRTSFSNQVQDVANFVKSLPAGTRVLIGYMQNGTVRSTGFTADQEVALKDLRIPFGVPGITASPYFCLSEFVKNWPSQAQAARVVLMITNGVDPYNGSVSPLNQDSPYVETAQKDAQRAGVAVYSIYYADRGIRGGLASFSGQSYLSQVAGATGGETYNQGTITPPSLTPYLNQFRHDLDDTYIMRFKVDATHERGNTLTPIKLKSNQAGLKVHAPAQVHAGQTS